MQEQELKEMIFKMQEAGLPSSAIKRHLEMMAQEMTPTMSQRDGVTISQSQPDAPGVYISSDVQQQEAFNEALRMQEARYLENAQARGPAAAPLTQAEVVQAMAMSNPQYQVVEPKRTTVNDAGHIVHY